MPHVDILFDCFPLRSISRLEAPLDASPKFQQLCQRIKQAAEKHGLFNSYYLHNARCTYHLTNDPQIGMLEFTFEGTVLTDSDDRKTLRADLHVEIRRETCDWLTEPVVAWFRESVSRAAIVEFDRYIAAGDLEQTIRRLDQVAEASDTHGGFLGMGL